MASNGEVVAGRYELRELIGEGGMSRVYRATDTVLNQTVAVKFLREEYGSDPAFVARFQREARAVASLSSPYIVDIYDYGHHATTYFIVMEFVDGGDLTALMRREGRVSLARSVPILEEVLHGLAEAHRHGIIHRDVKPHNIVIRKDDGLVKLTDFGIAHARDDVQITTAGTALGTVNYMAPEQAEGGAVSPATDLYAVGVVLFQMLAGRLPFLGDASMAVMLAHLRTPPPSLASVGVRVPQEVEEVVARALAKNPAARFQSADEMRAALAPFAHAVSDVPQAVYEAPTRVVASAPPQPFAHTQAQPRPAVPPPVYVANPNQTSVVAPDAPTRVATPAYSTPPQTAPVPEPKRRGVGGVPLLVVLAVVIVGGVLLLPRVLNTPASRPTRTAGQTPAVSGTGAAVKGSIGADKIEGAYRRDDNTLFGRQEVALYGAQSGFNEGRTTFTLPAPPAQPLTLTVTGLDDERADHCGLQVLVNGTPVYAQPNTFPNTPGNDNGVGGADRYWGQMRVRVPATVLKGGANTLVLRNTTPGADTGIPYMLIAAIDYST